MLKEVTVSGQKVAQLHVSMKMNELISQNVLNHSLIDGLIQACVPPLPPNTLFVL